MPGRIRIQGARTHNLCDVSVDLPREAWTVVCGVSGSGKSSLVLDTLGAEARRRFLGALGRTPEGLDLLPRPDVDRIDGLLPAVVLGAAERAPGPLETVGTLTEASHALRALWARAALPRCPVCGSDLPSLPRAALVERLLALPEGTRLLVTVRLGRGAQALAAAERAGYVRVRLDGGEARRLEEVERDRVAATAAVDVVLDRIVVAAGARERVRDSVEQALALGGGVLRVRAETPGRQAEEATHAVRPYCGTCDRAWPSLSARLLAPTNAEGACPACAGSGEVPAAGRPAAKRPRAGGAARRGARRAAAAATPDEPVACASCRGARLAPYGAAARWRGRTLPELEATRADEALAWLIEHAAAAPPQALPALEEARARLATLLDVGLEHLALARPAQRLARGELRRARLAAALGHRMSGLLYVLDEPMAGCHALERVRLRERLAALARDGATVVSVEHDLDAVRAADHVVELGPGAGAAGGRVVAAGTPAAVAAGDSALARALARAPAAARRRPRGRPAWVSLEGLTRRNLVGVAARFPVPGLTCVAGPSGAGKGTLVFGLLAPLAQAALRWIPPPPRGRGTARGLEAFAHVSASEARVARSPRTLALSLLAAFAPLRELYAATLEARARGWREARFSLAVAGGRCEPCKGTGALALALRDAPETRVACEACGGRRYGPETEAVRVKGLAIADALALTLAEAAPIFRDLPRIGGPFAAATEVGLGHLPLGRPASELSGGEVLRLRLAAALARGAGGTTLYLLDEPAAGLHPDDVAHLTAVLDRLVKAGHAVVAVEHDLGLVAHADHVLELGPGAGPEGGRLLYEGPPAGLATAAGSPTGRALAARR